MQKFVQLLRKFEKKAFKAHYFNTLKNELLGVYTYF